MVPMVDETQHPAQRHFTLRGTRYELGHQVARGAFSTVYQARDEWGNRLVAKIYRADLPEDTWRREAALLQRLRHPAIVHLHGAFMAAGRGHLLLEDAGVSVGRARPSDSAQRAALALAIAQGLLQALHFLHGAGYVHADVNPGNVLVDASRGLRLATVKLCDLGLCFASSDPPRTRALAMWSPPPEYLASGGSGRFGPALDVYAAAMVLLQQLREPETPGFDPGEIRAGAPRAAAESLGTPLGRALADALHLDPAQRPCALLLWRRIRRCFDTAEANA